jgi:hypothetical protein
LRSELESTQAELEASQAELEASQAEVEQWKAEAAKQQEAAAAADVERTDAIRERDAAIAERDQVIATFDPEIQAQRAQALEEVAATICGQLASGEITPSGIRNAVPDALAAVPELAKPEIDAVLAEVQPCIDEAVANADAIALKAKLERNRHDGVYVVGEQIASGRWQSEANHQDCYWERTDSQGEIIDNHFGSSGAGLIVTVRGSDYSVEFDGCGEWHFLG